MKLTHHILLALRDAKPNGMREATMLSDARVRSDETVTMSDFTAALRALGDAGEIRSVIGAEARHWFITPAGENHLAELKL